MSEKLIELTVPWSLGQAQTFCAEVERVLATYGYHVALAGSVLYAGQSSNDLDLMIYPHKDNNILFEPENLADILFKSKLISAWSNCSEYPESIRTIFECAAKNAHQGKINLFFCKMR